MKRGSHEHKQSFTRRGRNSSTSHRVTLARAGIRVSLSPGWTPGPSVDPQALEFRAQADQWRRDTLHTSSLTKMIVHPSYLKIIGMGSSVLPLLFRELEQRPDHWLVALNAITGQDPAPTDSTFDEAVAAWLDWGRTHGYLG
jgi:hypothetical protein